MKDRATTVHGDNDCKVVCPSGPPPTCPIYACSQRLGKFGEDMSQPVIKKGAKKKKGGKLNWTS